MTITDCLPFNFQPLANLRQAMASLTLIVDPFRRRLSSITTTTTTTNNNNNNNNNNKTPLLFARLSSVAAAVEVPVLLEVGVAGNDDRDRSESAGLRRLAPTESLSLSVA